MHRSENQPLDPVWRTMKETGRLEARPVLLLESTASTNTDAMELGRKGAVGGTLVVAETQGQGRGRLGRSWLSPAGSGLYFSMVLRPELAPADLPKITLAAGLAVCQALETATGLAPAIKWPNDLLLDDKKIGGILTETGAITGSGADGKPLVILGVGLNVSTPLAAFPDKLRQRVTSLKVHSGIYFPRGTLLKAIVRRLDSTLTRLEKEGFTGILAEWRKRDATKGRFLAWLTPDGRTVSGVSLGPDSEGVLHIQDREEHIHEVLSGDIHLNI